MILLSMYSTGIKNHFNTKNHFDTIFHSNDVRITRLIRYDFKNLKIRFKQLKISFCESMRQTNNIAC